MTFHLEEGGGNEKGEWLLTYLLNWLMYLEKKAAAAATVELEEFIFGSSGPFCIWMDCVAPPCSPPTRGKRRRKKNRSVVPLVERELYLFKKKREKDVSMWGIGLTSIPPKERNLTGRLSWSTGSPPHSSVSFHFGCCPGFSSSYCLLSMSFWLDIFLLRLSIVIPLWFLCVVGERRTYDTNWFDWKITFFVLKFDEMIGPSHLRFYSINKQIDPPSPVLNPVTNAHNKMVNRKWWPMAEKNKKRGIFSFSSSALLFKFCSFETSSAFLKTDLHSKCFSPLLSNHWQDVLFRIQLSLSLAPVMPPRHATYSPSVWTNSNWNKTTDISWKLKDIFGGQFKMAGTAKKKKGKKSRG